ncbi:MAG TPA: ABC transporter permease [Alphaproteobacteria bacterium]|nr:ABC transporter permease [Alphaproteobacteria bacterium]
MIGKALSRAGRAFTYSPTLTIGCALLVAVLLPSLLAPLFYDLGLSKIASGGLNLPPSLEHPLGTQSEGRDVLAMLLVGTPATLSIGLIGGGIGVLLGTLLGMTSGYFGGRIDTVVRNVVDVGLTIPPFAILIMIAASFKVISLPLMGVAVALSAWMYPTRVIRSQVLSIRTRGYVRMAKLSGIGNLRIIFGELLPNLIPLIGAAAVNAVSVAILASIGLEVLGLGGQNLTLGTTIYFAVYYAAMWRGLWWWWLAPILVLVAIFLGLFLISTALDEVANPKLRKVAA